MLLRAVLTLSLIAQSVLAARFKVIAPSAKTADSVLVMVDGRTFRLNILEEDVPYFTGDVNLSGDSVQYKYVVDGKAEPFERTLEGQSTRNDFFNRPVTYANIPKLPTVIGENDWDKAIPPGPIWDTNYIPTVFVNGNPDEMESLITGLSKDIYNVKLTLIDVDDVHTFQNARFQLHKPGKTHNNAKQSWKWQLPEGQQLNGRDFFKIRHMEEDPTQIREKLYADILRAMGTAANQANMIRFFINGESMGTFNMLDDIPSYSYVEANFYGGKAARMGPLFDGASGASFKDVPDNYDSFIAAPESSENKKLLHELGRALSHLNPRSDADIAELKKHFNVDQFLRYMVMEFLTGHWDGYWQEQTNIGAYEDIDNQMVHFLAQDFDATFGVNIARPKDFVNVPYTEYPELFPGGYLINMFLQNDHLRETFETYLVKTVTTLFNNQTLTPHVLAYHEFILPDLKWDRNIKQRSPGIDFGWEFPQVIENLWKKVDAPNGNGGGADWGLCEWIVAKSKAVAREFRLKGI
ncbi:coth protein-domain-containing protein [Gongronella butleri]|nr:coth protein-domain-containing protein [Gongronella butleri]